MAKLLPPDTEAPNFNLQSTSGVPLSLSALRGWPVVIAFAARADATAKHERWLTWRHKGLGRRR